MDQVFLVLGGGKHDHQSELLKIKNTKVISVQPSSPEDKIHVIEKIFCLPVTPRVQKRAAPAPAINNNGVAITPTNAYLIN